MAPTFNAHARAALAHTLTPIQAHNALTARDTANADRPNPEKGILHPGDINNKAVFAIFGLLGVAIVAAGIWFFFWAKNGGFYFQQNDWDDYKSTVLRRKGPNGTTLSGATTATDLGGGSVYKDLHENDDDDNQTELTGITGGVSVGFSREKHRRHREQKERDKERRREEKRREKEEKKSTKSRSAKVAKSPVKRKVGDDGAVIDDEAEAEAAEYLRNYRHERPARVGGLNRESDASTWDGSTNPTESTRYTESTVTSELMSNRERLTPPSSPEKKKNTKGAGIRKVYSTADKRDSREAERIRAEARKLQEKGRAATAAASSSGGGRRNFSWQRDNTVDEGTAMMPPPSYDQSVVDTETATRSIPGSWAESDAGTGSDLGTRVYSHVIPGLSSPNGGGGSSVAGTDVRDYAEERRRNRRSGGGGYRRERQR
ncbi:unnamed protein product [Discula destructiva]